ncbi:hypothetical protein T07_5980 [Trichinella nelsoni]|uniref:Uncharacterized protein n=1 Tax=Trichinella nelsoni TaxID=6336 RepID=A0A0V0RFS8_9BILA|nr:hypothetical protein T07_5980 [Trichinella nelsoni]
MPSTPPVGWPATSAAAHGAETQCRRACTLVVLMARKMGGKLARNTPW